MTGVLLGAIAALGYGSADFVARFTSRRLGPRAALGGALLTSALPLSLYVLASGSRPTLPWGFAYGLLPLVGLLNAAMLLLLYRALARGPVAVAAPLVGSYPALVLILLVPFAGPPSPTQLAALMTTMTGIVLLARPARSRREVGLRARRDLSGATAPDIPCRLGAERGASRISAGTPSSLPPQQPSPRPCRDGSTDPAWLRGTILLSLAASAAVAVQFVAVQEAARQFDPILATWASRFFALVFVWLLAVVHPRRSEVPLAWWPALAAQGLLDAGAVLAIATETSEADRASVAIVSSCFSAITVGLARVFLREEVTVRQWAALGLILAGVATLAGRGESYSLAPQPHLSPSHRHAMVSLSRPDAGTRRSRLRRRAACSRQMGLEAALENVPGPE